jgi:protease secretion system membrane fusion protein
MNFAQSIKRLQQLFQKPGQDGTPEAPVVEPGPNVAVDARNPVKTGAWTLLIGLGGFLLWAALAPLDEGVPTQGMVTIDTKRKAVQHLTGGIVRAVHAREGEMVTAGEVLIKLDDAAIYASFQSTRQHYLTLRAMESRLVAEQAGAKTLSFHEDLLAGREDPWVEQLLINESQLFAARRAALQAEMSALQQSIIGQQGSLHGLDGVIPHRRNQLALLQQEIAGVRDLVAEGYVPLNRQMELERQAADVSASLSDLQGNVARTRGAIAELRARALQKLQEYQKEVNAQLADVRREVQADADKLRAVAEELGRTEIRAPSNGQVVGLVMQTVGGVIQPSQKLMDIVPLDEGLVLEAQISPHLIDRVRVGQETDIRFANFAHSPQLVVSGRVSSVSGDLLTEQGPGGQMMSYYLARVEVTPAGRRELGSRNLQAGMPAELVIKTGERSLLTYLLHPLLKRMSAAMKEE